MLTVGRAASPSSLAPGGGVGAEAGAAPVAVGAGPLAPVASVEIGGAADAASGAAALAGAPDASSAASPPGASMMRTDSPVSSEAIDSAAPPLPRFFVPDCLAARLAAFLRSLARRARRLRSARSSRLASLADRRVWRLVGARTRPNSVGEPAAPGAPEPAGAGDD